MKSQHHPPEAESPSGHEGSGLDPRLILKVVTIILGTLVVLVLATLLLFRAYGREYPHRTSEAAPEVTDAELPPKPRLQAQPLAELQSVRAQEDAHLDRYAWVDHDHGIAQIPIERAMALWAANYKPPTDNPAATNAAPAAPVTELQMRQQKAQEINHAP